MATKQTVINAVNSGKVVTILAENVARGDWHGTGYIVTNPDTGAWFCIYSIFNTYVEVKFPRYHDTEAKILEDIASQIKDVNVSGTVRMYSQLPCCQSCTNIIFEFKRKFPNIKLKVYVE